jgi:hypothetical protein
MLLDLRLLKDVGTVNLWTPTTTIEAYEREDVGFTFQLVDRAAADDGGLGGGRRYVPAPGATLTVTFQNVDDAKKVTRVATKPFVGDDSIWRANVLAADGLRGTVTISLALLESPATHRAVLDKALRLRSTGMV